MRKKVIIHLQEFFGISRKEARGAFVLICICLLAMWTPFLFRRFILPTLPVENDLPTAAQLDSIVAQMQSEKPISARETKAFSTTSKVVLRHFDPNTATYAELVSVGIPVFLSKRIEKFRNSGGRFRRKEDLLKIYDFPPDLFQKLESYMVIAQSESGSRRETLQYAKQAGKPPFPQKPTIVPFDINTCDTTQLVRLKGIGTKLSMRIIRFRDGLGGFHSAGQFSEVFGLDSLALSEMRRYCKIVAPVRKIHIKTAGADELSQHSYLKNRRMVAIIVNYRQQHGPFANADDLRKTKVIDEETLRKIMPYLAF